MEEKPNPYRAPTVASRIKRAPTGSAYGRLLFGVFKVYLCFAVITMLYLGALLAMTLLGYDPPFGR